MRVLIYALGGGLGHVTRSLSLARGLRAEGMLATIVTNSPFSDLIPPREVLAIGAELLKLSPAIDKAEVSQVLPQLVAESDHDVLVVDTFPRGLVGELTDVVASDSRPSVFVHRRLSPEYLAARPVQAAVANFELALAPGEEGPLLEQAESWLRTPPWLMREESELLNVAEARYRLGFEPADRLVLVVGTGTKEEADSMMAVASELAALEKVGVCYAGTGEPVLARPGATPVSALSQFPLIELLRGVDAVLGQGGYNLVHECRSVGCPLLAWPRKRRYDLQQQRLSHAEILGADTSATDILKRVLALPTANERTEDRSNQPPYVNGVSAAARAIRRLV